MSDVMKHLDLFSGIGGFALAAKWVWGENHNIHSFVEIDPFCQKVLKKHWPEVPIISNIKEYKHDGTAIDLLTGGFPCQPFSCAGKQRGKEDDRYLWPEMLRVISEVCPTWIIGENVSGIINMGLDEVLSDLENTGYTCQPFIIPACAVNAPHRRDRVWIVANRKEQNDRQYIGESKERQKPEFGSSVESEATQNPLNSRMRRRNNGNKAGGERSLQTERSNSNASNTKKTKCKSFGRTRAGWEGLANSDKLTSNPASIRPQNRSGMFSRLYRQEKEGVNSTVTRTYSRQKTGAQLWQEFWLEVATRLCRVDDGISRKMDRINRLKALGNAIVPQVVVPIMQAIRELECLTSQQN